MIAGHAQTLPVDKKNGKNTLLTRTEVLLNFSFAANFFFFFFIYLLFFSQKKQN
jgi:hypothetical protein